MLTNKINLFVSIPCGYSIKTFQGLSNKLGLKILQEAILDFVVRARKWNFEMFGNLFAKRRRILARLHGAQKALANNPNDFLLELEQQLISEYSLILMQEEEYWALKSRINTATFGDHNRSFFYVSTIVRRHRNKIRCLKDYIKNGFKKLYMTELNVSSMISDVSEFSCCFLKEEDRLRIDGDVTEEEVRAGL